MMSSIIARQLLDPERYQAAIARVSGALGKSDHDASTLLARDARSLARRLAAEVGRGWVGPPAARRLIQVDKLRSVVALEPLDRVVHTAVASALAQVFEARYPEGLFSYRRGRGPQGAAAVLRAAALAHRAAHPDPRTRALWVIRFDVANYGDSIPIDDDSELWTMLAAWLAFEPPWVARLVRELARCGAHGEFAARGVPNGSPLANPLGNLYLTDLDALLARSAVAAVRYGDDVGAVYETESAAEAALADALGVLTRKGLELRQTKVQRLFWTGSGRRPPDAAWQAARHVTMCGIDIAFMGADRVRTKRRRELLYALVTRLRALARLLPEAPAEARARSLCEAASNLMNPSSPLALPGLAPFLMATSCRTQLAEMDRIIAIEIAALAAGTRGPRAFRDVTWRSLHDLGLPSLTALRNR